MSVGRPAITVLIIDDEEDFARTLAERFSLRGITAHCAAGGEEGLASLRKALPDAVLLDMRMPGLSGLDVLQRLRGADAAPGWAGLPVFIVSGHTAEGSLREAEALGIQGYFSKPLQFNDLLEAIKRLALNNA